MTKHRLLEFTINFRLAINLHITTNLQQTPNLLDSSIFNKEITDIYAALSKNNIDRAEELLTALEATLGHNEVPEVVQLQVLLWLKKQTVLSYKTLDALVGNRELTNEEKESVAGSINRWIDTSNDYWTTESFFYFQPKTYWYDHLSPEDRLKSIEEQQKCCEENGLVTVPFSDQRFTELVVRTDDTPSWRDTAALYMTSTRNDIVDIEFPLEDWDKVKLFIQENYHHLTPNMLKEWSVKNGYFHM